MNNPLSRHRFFAWPTAARLQNGKIAVVASGYRLAHVCPFGKTVIAYSEDEGKSYTLPAPVIDTTLDDRDGGILAFGDRNVIVTSFNNTRRFQRRDFHKLVKESEIGYCSEYLNTITDEEEERDFGSNFRISNDCGVTFGNIYKSPVSSPHGPTELSDGSVLWVGTVNLTREAHETEDNMIRDALALEENKLAAYLVEPDGSMTLCGEIPQIYENGKKLWCFEPHAIGLDDGSVICHIRVQNSPDASVYFTVYQTESADGGRTWSLPHKILGDKGGAPSHLIKHSSGVLIAAYGRREIPYGIRVMLSEDNGKTWSVDHEIYRNTMNSDLGYPSTVECKDGSLITVFYAKADNNDSAVIMQQRWGIRREV